MHRNGTGEVRAVLAGACGIALLHTCWKKGIDIRYIKYLPGYFDIRTTERYLHVRRDKLVTVVSPPDDLWKNQTDW